MMIDDNKWLVLKDAIDITNTDYDIKWYDAENFEGYIDGDEMLSIIEDLLWEIEQLKDEKKDIERRYYETDEDDYDAWRDSQL